MSTPPWGRGDPRSGVPPWMWPVVIDARQREVTPPTPLRIGDAERDEAVSALGDHFAAGRLTRDELDERIERAMQAKFSTDLEPLLADLPSTSPQPARPGPGQWPNRWDRRPPSPVFWLFGLLVVGLVVTAIAVGAPWILWWVFWMFVFSRFWSRRWLGPRRQADWQGHRPGPPARRPGPR